MPLKKWLAAGRPAGWVAGIAAIISGWALPMAGVKPTAPEALALVLTSNCGPIKSWETVSVAAAASDSRRSL